MIEAVLFDIGDTIFHFETSRARRFLEAATRPGYDRLSELGHKLPTYESYVRSIKRAFQCAYVWSRLVRREVQLVRAFKRLHLSMGIDLDDALMADLGHRCTQELLQFLTADEDAADVIAYLASKNLKLGLVSNTPFPGFAIDEFLRSEGLLQYFPVRVYSSEVHYMKPHRKIFRIALERLEVAPERTLFIGDRVDKDVVGPARVGMRTALFTKNGRGRFWRARPDHIIHKLTDIPSIIHA